ncbi:MAG: superoxide dismutase [Candidatus Kerfeldbacteria bacterium]|nr:superoxide dismutase [Candidatus Kerfeldbacteria bacterium]
MPFSIKDLPWGKDALKGISAKTNEIHHDKLYAGYVTKRNEIEEALKTADRSKSAATYSPYRALKLEETFNADGQILHELYFETLGGDGKPTDGPFVRKVRLDFGSWEAFVEDAIACAKAARGWMITAYDPTDGKIRNFLADAHNHGGVWGSVPLWTIDCYEHAYFIDYGSDRKAYIQAVLNNVNWDAVNARFAVVAK